MLVAFFCRFEKSNYCWKFRYPWEMKGFQAASLGDMKGVKPCLRSILLAASLICLVLLVGNAFLKPEYKEVSRLQKYDQSQMSKSDACKSRCKARGRDELPEGIVTRTANLEMRPLWGMPSKREGYSQNLFAVAAGIKQKEYVDKMVKRFLSNAFIIMVFHYDGILNDWDELEWNNEVIHISAMNQTKWWFAKRFLHPAIVADYDYIFLWDEDLGVINFHPKRYLSIIRREGLEISQPALDPLKSEVHHQITARGRRSEVHRRTYKPGLQGRGCDRNSTSPPCTGWIELMAPVFSKAAWQCVWHMIQNDLVHAWGLDMQLGYCAQGDRTRNVGVVDSEYIVHYGLPTLGGLDEKKVDVQDSYPSSEGLALLDQSYNDNRISVRRQSFLELEIFRKRWKKAVNDDPCWNDPYPQLHV